MAGTACCVVLLIVAFATAQYNDDSDYNDFDFYENLPTSYERSANDNYRKTSHDDFYIITEYEGTKSRATKDSMGNDVPTKYPRKNVPSKSRLRSDRRDGDWDDGTKKIYRYTKHRIPGYDYDELDFMASRSLQECDRRSVWTNCVCQFTCREPNVVDCFTPCRTGCECKEDYVYDDKTDRCIIPGQCDDAKNFYVDENR